MHRGRQSECDDWEGWEGFNKTEKKTVERGWVVDG
jgi:hypothetical protein